MYKKNVPIETIRYVNEKHYLELKQMATVMNEYSLLTISKELGIMIPAESVSIDRLVLYGCIHNELNKDVGKNNGR